MIRSYLPKALLLVIGVMFGVLLEARIFGPLRGQPAAQSIWTYDFVATGSTPSDGSIGARNSSGPVPVVSVEQPTFDFGTILQGSKIKHEFTLRNSGEAPLIIEGVRPGCGCTVAKLASKRVEGGETTTVKATFASKGRLGAQNRAIFVETNDPKASRLRLALVGTIESFVTKEPKSLALGRVVTASDSASGNVDVRAGEGFQFNVTDIRTSHDEIVATVQEVEPGSHVRVSVSLKRSSLPDGQFMGWVRLVTDHDGPYHEIPITVRARIGEGGPIAVGDSPDIAGPALDGDTAELSRLGGHPTIVVFWASWCPHCREAIPHLVSLHKKYHGQGLRILGVNTDREKSKAVAACDQWQVPWRNIHFDSGGSPEFKNPLSKKYEVNGIPAIFLINRDGKVRTTGLRGPALESVVDTIFNKDSVAKLEHSL